jgi:hypothetical protein
VTQGLAALESGTQLLSTPIFNFLPAAQAPTDANGSFKICTATVSQPSVLVVVAQDNAGNAYPPFVATVSGPTAFGVIPMGGCVVMCGLEGQQQSSLPAVITGTILTSPIPKQGSVEPQYSLQALDGSTNVWSLAMPVSKGADAFAFQTSASGCASADKFCTSYTFQLPSQKPVVLGKGGTIQEAGAPVYSIFATPDPSQSCLPSQAVTVRQHDGVSLLTGGPGAVMTAEDISFTNCQ